MRNRQGHPQARVGRKHKGDRHLFQLARLPDQQTDEVLRCAAERGLSQSEYLAVVIARAHGFMTAWPPRTGPLVVTPRTHLDHPRLSSRVPRAAAEVAMDEAEAHGLPNARYMAAVVAQAHGFAVDLPERLALPGSQEALISA